MGREVAGELGGFGDALERFECIRMAEGRSVRGAEDPRRHLTPSSPERLGLPVDLKAAQRVHQLLRQVHRACVT
jgi:hypothetical protein